MKCDHTKKYYVIDGCRVTVSFSKTSDLELFDRVKNILLTSVESSQICGESAGGDKFKKKQRGIQCGAQQGLLPVSGFNG